MLAACNWHRRRPVALQCFSISRMCYGGCWALRCMRSASPIAAAGHAHGRRTGSRAAIACSTGVVVARARWRRRHAHLMRTGPGNALGLAFLCVCTMRVRVSLRTGTVLVIALVNMLKHEEAMAPLRSIVLSREGCLSTWRRSDVPLMASTLCLRRGIHNTFNSRLCTLLPTLPTMNAYPILFLKLFLFPLLLGLWHDLKLPLQLGDLHLHGSET